MPERPLAVITGASSGIGAMFARKLAARGYDLLLIARREDRLRSLTSEFAEAYHVAAEPMRGDLARDDDLERVAGRIRSAPRLGLLVNNAGFGSLGYFVDTDPLGQGYDAAGSRSGYYAPDPCRAGQSHAAADRRRD